MAAEPPSTGSRTVRGAAGAPDRGPDEPFPVAIPHHVAGVLESLWTSGHAAYLVGGAVRDALLGREREDWDVATDALPPRMLELFALGRYENRFGTVSVDAVQVTTFRRDHRYADHRRPDDVTFTSSLEEDLVRRDFTVNAIAWGRAAAPEGARRPPARWADPTGGRDDLRRRSLRAVGDAAARFDEDALRLLRAARFSAELDFGIEPATRAAMEAHAGLVRHLSAERVGGELRRLVRAERASYGFAVLADTGLLTVLAPALAAQRGVPQDKVPGHDLWAHSLATLDAAAALAPHDESLRLAAVLHDIGKPSTSADGRFLGHDEVGSEIARQLLSGYRVPAAIVDRVTRLVRHHMIGYTADWSDAAVRRFMRRVGTDLVDDLLLLREADEIGSGRSGPSDALRDLRRRVAEQRAMAVPLALRDLAVDGHDLQRELGIPPGPELGRILGRLMDRVVADPARNERERLLHEARRIRHADA